MTAFDDLRDLSRQLAVSQAAVRRYQEEREELKAFLDDERTRIRDDFDRTRSWPSGPAKSHQNGRYLAKLAVLHSIEQLLEEQEL